MYKKVIKTNEEAKQSLKNGVDRVADSIKVTLGPKGSNAIIRKANGSHLITNDGDSIAREIFLDDEIEELGAGIIKELSKKMSDKAGDGTTTATVIAQKIIEKGFNELQDDSLVKNSRKPIDIKREISSACKDVVSELKELAKPIKGDEVKKVASISVESDEVGEIIADIINKTGKDGVVTVEESNSFEVKAEVTDGLKINKGYISPYMASNDKGEAVVENVHVLITNHKIERQEQITPIIGKLAAEGIKNLVLIADDFNPDLVSVLVVNRLKGAFNVLAIKKPYMGDIEDLEDLSSVVGGKIANKDKSIEVESLEIEDLGQAGKVIATKEDCLFVNGKGNVKERIKVLKGKETDSEFDKKKIEDRIAQLSGGIGVIKVGAQSETERDYLVLKIKDGVAATKAAISEGVVKGGGLALKEIAEKLPKSIITEALKAPYNQIQENAGGIEIAEYILDPVKITRMAVESACSLAGELLTTEVAVADKEEKKCCHE